MRKFNWPFLLSMLVCVVFWLFVALFVGRHAFAAGGITNVYSHDDPLPGWIGVEVTECTVRMGDRPVLFILPFRGNWNRFLWTDDPAMVSSLQLMCAIGGYIGVYSTNGTSWDYTAVYNQNIGAVQ